MAQGKFIVFEGIDGAGKTTQIARLAEALSGAGRTVYTTAEPTESVIGDLLRAALSGKDDRTPAEMAALFALDRIGHNREIAAQLAAGKDVICDRYYYSSLAYQGSLCDYEWVRRMNCSCPDIRRPDLCVFLDLTTDQALSRIAVRGIEAEIYEKRETLSLFRDTFLRILRTLPDSVAVVDASGNVDEVAAAVRAAVKRRLFI